MTHKIGITFFAAPSAALPEGHAFIEVFHDWIRRRELPELMIDVADYGHVHGGPSVYFCGHESDYAIVRSVRPGILYRRKRAPESGAPIVDGLARLARVVMKLQAEPKLAGLALDPSRFALSWFDRLAAPNNEATATRLAAEARTILEPIVGAVETRHVSGDGRGVLELDVKPTAHVSWERLAG